MSKQSKAHPVTAALIFTILSALGSMACMLGLIFSIPAFAQNSGAEHKKALIPLLIWGGVSVACVVLFCIALMYLLRERRQIHTGRRFPAA